MCEPLFQIGRQPLRPIDLVLPVEERRLHERRSVQEVLVEADHRHKDRRFTGKPVSGWGDL